MQFVKVSGKITLILKNNVNYLFTSIKVLSLDKTKKHEKSTKANFQCPETCIYLYFTNGFLHAGDYIFSNLWDV